MFIDGCGWDAVRDTIRILKLLPVLSPRGPGANKLIDLLFYIVLILVLFRTHDTISLIFHETLWLPLTWFRFYLPLKQSVEMYLNDVTIKVYTSPL